MAPQKNHARPDYAFIGNHTYQINWLTTDEWVERDFPMDKDGLTYGAKSCIFVRLIPERPEALYQEIVLHEVTHAVWDTVGLSLIEEWNNHGDNSNSVEENVILLQTPMLLFVLKQNPHFTNWLLADGQVRRK